MLNVELNSRLTVCSLIRGKLICCATFLSQICFNHQKIKSLRMRKQINSLRPILAKCLNWLRNFLYSDGYELRISGINFLLYSTVMTYTINEFIYAFNLNFGVVNRKENASECSGGLCINLKWNFFRKISAIAPTEIIQQLKELTSMRCLRQNIKKSKT